MHKPLASILLGLAAALTGHLSAQVPGGDNAMASFLAEALKRYPAADANKDGVLTLEEGQAYLRKVRGQAAETSGSKGKAKGVPPTFADVAYGAHERNRLDFWQTPKASGGTDAPVVVLIHGGGFVGGDKSSWHGNRIVKELLDKGVSCAAINYRFRDQAPIQDILKDAARAVQFIRHKSGEWGVDKTRIAAMGGSAGAGTSLWLTTRDDLADPTASDPVLRESSRVRACVLAATQATYDITRWESYLGKADPRWARPEEGALFYGFSSTEDLGKEEAKAILRECDMLSWISRDDGPVFCTVNQPDGPVQSRNHWLHHPKHAEEVEKYCKEAGIPCTVARNVASEASVEFLLKNLELSEAE